MNMHSDRDGIGQYRIAQSSAKGTRANSRVSSGGAASPSRFDASAHAAAVEAPLLATREMLLADPDRSMDAVGTRNQRGIAGKDNCRVGKLNSVFGQGRRWGVCLPWIFLCYGGPRLISMPGLLRQLFRARLIGVNSTTDSNEQGCDHVR
jgi:hypothetical protein